MLSYSLFFVVKVRWAGEGCLLHTHPSLSLLLEKLGLGYREGVVGEQSSELLFLIDLILCIDFQLNSNNM